MPIQAQIVVGELPPGECYNSEQARLNGFMETVQIFFPGTASVFNFGSSTPTVDNQAYPWLRTTGGGYFDKIYTFVNGVWASPHPTPANAPIAIIYFGSLASLETYDGGSVGAVTATTGPMWEVDPRLDGRFPMGVSAGHPLGDEDGSETVVQTVAQMASHSHEIPSNISLGSTGGNITGTGDNLLSFAGGDRIDTANTGGNDPMSVLNPMRAVFFITRSARTHYAL